MAKLLRVREVCEVTGLSRASVYRFLAGGVFPRPIHIGERSPRWRSETIESWIAERESCAA